MANYTTLLRTVCESVIDEYPATYHNYKQIIEKARPYIFDFDYPIFDSSYKQILETKIIKHYFMREIGLETPALFLYYLDMKMNEIMPYYNQLYESQLLKFNPFYDRDLWTVHQGNNSGDKQDTGSDNTYRDKNEDSNTNSNFNGTENTEGNRTLDGKTDSTQTKTGSSDGTDDSRTTNFQDVTGESDRAYSDTPQGQLALVKNYNYLTNYTYDTQETHTDGEGTNKVTSQESHTDSIDTNGTTNDTETSSNEKSTTNKSDQTNIRTEEEHVGNTYQKQQTISNIDEYIEHVSGKLGGQSYSFLLNEFRNTFLNIDLMVIDELNDLFMGIY